MESPYSASKVTEKTEREIDRLIRKSKFLRRISNILASIGIIAALVYLITKLIGK